MLYGHGDDIFSVGHAVKANFSSNVWFNGTNARISEYLKRQLSDIGNYPEPTGKSLRQALAKHHDVHEDEIMVCNGATEAIYTVAQAFQRQSATIFCPTFAEYEDACTTHHLSCTFATFSQLYNSLQIDTDLAFICNPNNPTGEIIETTALEQHLQNNPNTVFVIDEAYAEFTAHPQSLITKIHAYKNLIILKSLTKLFAVPGLRIGYLMASDTLMERLNTYKMPWSVNALALAAGHFIMDHHADLLPPMSECLEETQWLKHEIDQIPHCSVTPSLTTYLLVQLQKGSAHTLKQDLLEQHGLLIRDASNFRGLSAQYVRVATQSHADNQTLVNALRTWKPRN